MSKMYVQFKDTICDLFVTLDLVPAFDLEGYCPGTAVDLCWGRSFLALDVPAHGAGDSG